MKPTAWYDPTNGAVSTDKDSPLFTPLGQVWPLYTKQEQEPFEYWNAVEGWVKIDEVREHFDSVGCGTIYKTAGEGREPLYTTPPQRTVQEPVAWIWEKEDGYTSIETHSLSDEDMKNVGVKSMKPLYAKPQFIGLSEDEIVLISADCAATHQHDDIEFAKAIESKLKDKNI